MIDAHSSTPRRIRLMKILFSALLLLTIIPAWAGDARIIDLTHSFDAETVYWPTASGFELDVDFKGMTEAGFYYEANSFRSAEHGGTHLDAPSHFAKGR